MEESKKVRLGFGMICKDEAPDIERILKDYGSFFDEIRITITNEANRELIASYIEAFSEHYPNILVEHSYFTWINDFSAARNFNKAQFTQSDYYFWVDADDSIGNPELIRKLAQQAFENDISIVFCGYNYAYDDDGNVNAWHNRERLIKLTDNLYWNKTIHENVLPKSVKGYDIAIDKDLVINHRQDHEHAYNSALRNIKYLLEEYHRDKENTDPRIFGYLGRMFMGVGEYSKAINFLDKHIKSSCWDEDRYMSWCQLAEIFRIQKDYDNAIAAAMEGILEREDYPDAYYKLHDVYTEKGDYKKAIHWGELGARHKPPETMMLVDPTTYTWKPAFSMAFCYFQLGEFKSAKKLFDHAISFAPRCAFSEKAKMFEDALEHKNYVDHFLWLYTFLQERDQTKLTALVRSIPKELEEHEALLKLQHIHLEPKVWSNKSIAFYCPPAADPWADPSVDTGIGGSEEAVVYLSREFVKMGYEVVVFNECNEMEGLYHGVQYLNLAKFNPKDTFNILVSWRCNIFTYFECTAKHKWIWMHDILDDGMLNGDRWKKFDKILVLSDYHKSLVPKYVSEDKILVTANGIVFSDFKSVGIEREFYRCIYGSSYNRGVEFLVDMWPQIRKAVPQAELHIFYGWNTANKAEKGNHDFKRFRERLERKFTTTEGVFEHGRIGQKDLIKEYQKSAIWAYPTDFPEISCITAMKAQASGCIPVTSTYAAVNETVKSGYKVLGSPKDNDDFLVRYKTTLINVLKDSHRKPNNFDASIFDWSNVAKQWEQEWSKPDTKSDSSLSMLEEDQYIHPTLAVCGGA